LRDVGYQSAWIIGAVCPARDSGVALVMTRLDTAAMNLFLAELAQAVAPGAHGIVLMDKAGWHTAGDLIVPENLSLVFLPPYSPELNPIERLWLHLRDNRLSHCVFQTTGEIVDTCCEAWNWLLGQTGRIRSLCSYPWLDFRSNARAVIGYGDPNDFLVGYCRRHKVGGAGCHSSHRAQRARRQARNARARNHDV
jgi:transposase